jgi:hypothetical protein
MASTCGDSALQNRVAVLEQQLLHAQELHTVNAEHTAQLLRAKDALLAAKDGELAALRVALSQVQQLALSATRQADATEGGAGEHAKKRARPADDSCSPLLEDGILDAVFSYVGIGDNIYTGAVSRRWNGRYTKLCHNNHREGKADKLITAHKSALLTAARLQLALKSSLTMATLEGNHKVRSYVALRSLEPIAVLTIAREHDVHWQWRPHDRLANLSAQYGKLKLLQWLHECGCPWKAREVCLQAARSGNVDMLICLQQVTAAAWSHKLKRDMLFEAGWKNMGAAVQWLRQQGASWPNRFYARVVTSKEQRRVCWTARIVKWALDNGCTWGDWQCDQLRPDLYKEVYDKLQASKLFA